jgi:hypothetical protein
VPPPKPSDKRFWIGIVFCLDRTNVTFNVGFHLAHSTKVLLIIFSQISSFIGYGQYLSELYFAKTTLLSIGVSWVVTFGWKCELSLSLNSSCKRNGIN